jgi:hypothetical protein
MALIAHRLVDDVAEQLLGEVGVDTRIHGHLTHFLQEGFLASRVTDKRTPRQLVGKHFPHDLVAFRQGPDQLLIQPVNLFPEPGKRSGYLRMVQFFFITAVRSRLFFIF